MALIDWKPEFAVGLPEVDYEHRQMIAMINEVAEKLETGAHAPVDDVLAGIHACISAHFALEEKIMRERSYDFYDEHKDDHERLLDDIREIMDEYEDDGPLVRQVLAGRLEAWFGVHFRTHDARLHRCL